MLLADGTLRDKEKSRGIRLGGRSGAAERIPPSQVDYAYDSPVSHETETVRVNFGREIPLFPLASVTLMPHAVLPLHIFEPRYRQMVEHVIDGAGQIAMAVIDQDGWPSGACATPRLRPAVCVGHIVQHERLLDGRFNILVQGICRARIVRDDPPQGDRLYRQAILRPIESTQCDEDELDAVRERLHFLLRESSLRRLAASENVAACLSRPEAPTAAILELVGVSLITNDEVRYRLLEEGNPNARAELIEDELLGLRSLLSRAEKQLDPDAPKGVSWN